MPTDDLTPSAAPSLAATARRYTDQEVALVIKRAAELQAQAAQVSEEERSGLSLTELEQIAREAGLDPGLVRRAATELDTRHTTTPRSRFLGAPSVLTLERTIDGEVPASEYEPIVEDLRRAFNDNGYVSTLGRSLAWSSMAPNGRGGNQKRVNVAITPRNGRTTIRVEESLRPVAGGLFGGIMGGVGGGTSGLTLGLGSQLLHSFPAGVGLWLLALGGTYGLARTIFTHVARSRGERLRDVLNRIAEHVAATAVSGNALPDGATEPRLPG